MSSKVKKYDTHGFENMRETPHGPWVPASDYAALEAENARLKREVSHWQGLAVTNRKVADDALAQLAAIQGETGKAEAEKQLQEWARDKFSFAGRYKGSVYGNTDWALARAIHTDLLAHYQRITAAMAAEVERLRTAVGGMLFAFDDGVGQEWSKELLDFVRKLTPAKEYKA